jgi:hypothetical protein
LPPFSPRTIASLGRHATIAKALAATMRRKRRLTRDLNSIAAIDSALRQRQADRWRSQLAREEQRLAALLAPKQELSR